MTITLRSRLTMSLATLIILLPFSSQSADQLSQENIPRPVSADTIQSPAIQAMPDGQKTQLQPPGSQPIENQQQIKVLPSTAPKVEQISPTMEADKLRDGSAARSQAPAPLPSGNSQQIIAHPGITPKAIEIPPKLEVERLGKEFVDRGTEIVINEPRKLELYWTNLGATAKSAQWSLSDINPNLYKNDPTKISLRSNTKSGNVGSCASGATCLFYVNLSQAGVLPPNPPNTPRDFFLWVQIEGVEGSNAESNLVVIHYQKDTSTPTVFTTKGLNPELWQPITIEIKLDTLTISQPDEPGDEEPYLLVAAIWADGTTVDPLHPGFSQVRVDASASVHGNVPKMIYPQGSVTIPPSTGTFKRSILPVGLDAIELSESLGKGVKVTTLTKNTLMSILVVAMEKDSSSDATANAAKTAMVTGLQNGLNEILHNLSATDVKAEDFPEQLQNRLTELREQVMKKTKDAAVASTLGDFWWMPGMIVAKLGEVSNPDDYIGVNYTFFSYEDFRHSNAIRIDMPLEGGKDSVHYRVTGWARRM